MLRLIVNADDLGLTAGVNRAILQAHERGAVTSATLMANSRQFGAAVSALLGHEGYRARRLGIGCHVVLIDGEPLSSAAEIPSLLAPGRQFRHSMGEFAMSAVRGRISPREVMRETTAQIRKIQAAGIELSHVDCHKHVHMFPAIMEGVAEAAIACGVRAIRNPFEVPGSVPFSALAGQPAYWVRLAETAVLRALCAGRFAQKARQFGLATTGGSLGVTLTGALDLPSACATLRGIVAGDYELVCHPGYNDAELAQAGTRLRASRQAELEILSAPELLQTIQAIGAQRINFWDLQQPASPWNEAVHSGSQAPS